MDSKVFKLVSNKVVFEEFFIDDIEDTITYYFVCKDRELTDLLYGHKDYGRPISGFTVSAEVSLGSDGDCPLLMMSPFVIENGDNAHYNMTVYNILGQPMIMKQINAGSTECISHSLATGVYIISLQNNQNAVSVKVIAK